MFAMYSMNVLFLHWWVVHKMLMIPFLGVVVPNKHCWFYSTIDYFLSLLHAKHGAEGFWITEFWDLCCPVFFIQPLEKLQLFIVKKHILISSFSVFSVGHLILVRGAFVSLFSSGTWRFVWEVASSANVLSASILACKLLSSDSNVSLFCSSSLVILNL